MTLVRTGLAAIRFLIGFLRFLHRRLAAIKLPQVQPVAFDRQINTVLVVYLVIAVTLLVFVDVIFLLHADKNLIKYLIDNN